MKRIKKKLDPVLQKARHEMWVGLHWSVLLTAMVFLVTNTYGTPMVWVYIWLLIIALLGVGWRALEYQSNKVSTDLKQGLGKPLKVFGDHLIVLDGNIRQINDSNKQMVEYLKRVIMKDSLDVSDPVSLSAYYASVALLDKEHLIVLRENIKGLQKMNIKRFDQLMEDDQNMFDVYDDLLLRIELRLD